MRKYATLPLLLLLLSVLMPSLPAYTQEEELVLRLRRDFGYSSGTGDIQGSFSLRVSGPDDLVRVEYLLDGESIGEGIEAPFNFKFNTDSFSPGAHTLQALGYKADGSQIYSNEVRARFVTAAESWRTLRQILIPIFAIIFGVILFTFLIPLLTERKTKSAPLGMPRNYGLLGGTICPNCQRPFAIHVYGLNLAVGKLDRCPHCGKWRLVRRAPIELLRAAEIAEKNSSESSSRGREVSADEKLRKDLEDSRYMDS